MLHSDQLIINSDRGLLAVGEDGFLFVVRDGLDVRNSRDTQAWAWKVLDHYAFTLDNGHDLHSPWEGDAARSEYQVIKALISLISFLIACGESEGEGENAGLFSQPVRLWAETHGDELRLASMELSSMIGEE